MTIEPDEVEILPEDQEWFQAGIRDLTFADVVKAFRENNEMTQTEAARRLGMTRQALNGYESGRRIPSPKQAKMIAEVLGIPMAAAVICAINDQLKRDELPIKITRAAS